MKLSTERISELKAELRKLGLEYDDEKSTQVGMAIMRFVIAKVEREKQLQMEIQYGQQIDSTSSKK